MIPNSLWVLYFTLKTRKPLNNWNNARNRLIIPSHKMIFIPKNILQATLYL